MMSAPLVRPVVYGSMAFHLGKQEHPEGHTHRWSIYLRGLHDEDLSHFVKQVTFKLHPSCKPPEVVCEKPPYVVTQTGWGEFNATISIAFSDEKESCVDIVHALALYPPGSSSNQLNLSTLVKKPVVCENYEELLFHDVSPAFAKVLKKPVAELTTGFSPQELAQHFTTFNEVECMKTIVAAQNFVSAEIERARERLIEARNTILDAKGAKDGEDVEHEQGVADSQAKPVAGVVIKSEPPDPKRPKIKQQ